MRGRLILGVPVLWLFAAVFAINVGVQVHAYAEAWQSTFHFREQREEAAREDPSIDLDAPPHPRSRLGEMDRIRGRHLEQMLLSLGAVLFFGGLATLGRRTLKRARSR